MMNLRQTQKAMAELRQYQLTAKSDPVMWNVTLGLEAMAKDLEQRLDRIENTQRAILQALQQRR